MTGKPKAKNCVDELLADNYSPEVVLEENGLLKQLSKWLIERALTGKLSHHLDN